MRNSVIEKSNKNIKRKASIAKNCMAIFLLLIILSSCSDPTELETTIELQEERISQLEEQLEEQAQLISSYQKELTGQEELEAGLSVPPEFRQGLVDDLIENVDDLTIPWIGSNPRRTRLPTILNEDEISIYFNHWSQTHDGYLITRISGGSFTSTIFIFSFQLESGDLDSLDLLVQYWENVNVSWEVLAYSIDGNMRLAEEHEPRHLTDLEIVTIRIYYQDPDGDVLEFYYEEHEIQGSQLWEETLRLMPDIRDLWYEGTTLYVDLMPIRWIGWGYDVSRVRRLYDTFSSFPNVSEIRFLTMGNPGLSFSYAEENALIHIFNVEENRIAHLCELAVDDPWLQGERWQSHWKNQCE